jgi:uncharacterized sulfatase
MSEQTSEPWSRRRLLGASFAAPALLLGQKTQRERPNILFIPSDDLNTSLGCYGHPVVRSPNIDALAGRGVRFDRAYCQFPLCGPSRASLLSGMRPDSIKITKNGLTVRDGVPDVITLPQLFRKHEYLSARFGKMYHMDVPASVGTSKYDDPASWDIAVSPPGLEQRTKGEGRMVTPGYPLGNGMQWIDFAGSDKEQADAGAAERTIELMDKQGNRPWFIGLGFVRPHVPFVAPSRFYDLYPVETITPVVNPANDRDDIPSASEKTITGRGNDMGMNDKDKRESLRGYYASVSYMDSLVGRVLDHLKRKGLAERTSVVFWGDHGWHLGEHFRWQKRSLFEESARVPLIVSAPGRKGNGRASRALVELVDLYPTVADLAGLTPPPSIEGQSLVPLLERPERAWKTAAFTQVGGPDGVTGRAVRTDRFRYIRWEGPEPAEELFDHVRDPREFRNLVHEPAAAGYLKEMRGVLDRGWRAAKATI